MFGRRNKEMAEAAAVAADAFRKLDTALRTADERLRELAGLPQLHRFPAAYREKIVNDFTREFAPVRDTSQELMDVYARLAEDVPIIAASREKHLRKECTQTLWGMAARFDELAAAMNSLAASISGLTATVFQRLSDCDSLRVRAMQHVDAARGALDLAQQRGHDVSEGRRRLDRLISSAPVLTDGVIYEGWKRALESVIEGADQIRMQADALVHRARPQAQDA